MQIAPIAMGRKPSCAVRYVEQILSCLVLKREMGNVSIGIANIYCIISATNADRERYVLPYLDDIYLCPCGVAN